MSETFTLTNGNITVGLSTFGGTITSIKDADGLEYLWQGNKEYWSDQAPIMFPICGSIREGKAESAQGPVSMPRHGIVRHEEWDVLNQTDTSILFATSYSDESLESYPYYFNLYAKYELSGKSLITTFVVENVGPENMPFSVGGHPGFNCPLIEGEDYTDYYIEFAEKETCSVPELVTETGLINITNRTPFFADENRLNLKHELFHKDAIQFDEIESRSVKYVSEKSGKGVKVDFPDMPFLCLWSTANDGPFVCIEPWTGISTCDDESDVFEEKRNTQIVRPGENKKYSFMISIL